MFNKVLKITSRKKIILAIYCSCYVSQAFSYAPSCQGYSVHTTFEGQLVFLDKTLQVPSPQLILCKPRHKYILRQLLKRSFDKQQSVGHETQHKNKYIVWYYCASTCTKIYWRETTIRDDSNDAVDNFSAKKEEIHIDLGLKLNTANRYLPRSSKLHRW